MIGQPPLALDSPFPAYMAPQAFEPERFRALIHSAPMAQQIRWWRAYPSPYYDPTTGTAVQAEGHDKWVRIEQTGPFWALIGGVHTTRAFFPEGSVENGDLTISVMPDEVNLGDHDWIIPIGRNGLTDAPVTIEKQTMVRGATITRSLPGLVSATWFTVTGSGTTFTQTFRPGDIIGVGADSAVVVDIASDVSMTTNAPPGTQWQDNAYTRGRDQLIYAPASRIDDIRTIGAVYRAGVDCVLGADGATIQWLLPITSPAAGSDMGVTYERYRRYVIMGDLGVEPFAVNGTYLPYSVVARLWGQESQRG